MESYSVSCKESRQNKNSSVAKPKENRLTNVYIKFSCLWQENNRLLLKIEYFQMISLK